MPKKSKRGYLIRFNADKTRFPDFCPVCNEPAEAVGTIIASKSKTGESLDREWSMPRSFGKGVPQRTARRSSGPTSVRMLQINTCENHAYSEEEIGRAKGLCAVVNGLSILIFVFAAFQLAFHLVEGIAPPLWLYMLVVGVAVLLIISYRGLGSSELERAIKIVDYTEEGATITVRLQNEAYAEQFIRINPSATVIESPERL
ncbi:MAG: hypothetical protein KGY80_06165 [Candidatus Thorarchaeota archaeon]|nr:hypothetical protein [Candidatus Thorarchaeota archaeon]